MAKPNTVIPFSKFINITTSGVSDTFTFNRLNALAITTPLIPMPATVEAGSLEAVAKLYGAVSQEYSYAEEFFGYTSKNATKAQKLTFYNSYPEAQKASLVGAAIAILDEIKQQGSLSLKINGNSYDFDINLENISSFTDAANIINDNLKQPKIDAVPYSLEGTTPSLPITAAATIDASELVIQDNQSEAIFTYTASITIDTSDGVDEVVTKLNTKELSDANLVWSNDGGVFKLSQINYSSASNTIPVKIFISESDIQVKLGLDKVTTQTGSPEVPAKDLGTCVYSTQTEGFIIQGSVASASQTIDYATGDMASILGLAETDGGYITKGTNGENLTEMLNHIGRINGDYVSIASINKIDTTDYEQIATWVNASGGRYAFIVISHDARLKSTNQIVYENLFGNDGFILIYGSNINMLAFMQAAIASVDFSVPGGMTNFNFIETPEFLDDSIGTSEELDGINANRANCCYIMGGYGQSQPLFGEGKIFGTNFNNIANYIGNSWIKAKMEIAGANLMISQGFIALRGGKGQSLILASLQEIIALAKVSDIIVTVGTDGLLAAEKAKIVSVTGNANAVNLIESNGYYVNVLPLTADDIANEQMRVQFIYTKNVPLNRLVVQNIVI